MMPAPNGWQFCTACKRYKANGLFRALLYQIPTDACLAEKRFHPVDGSQWHGSAEDNRAPGGVCGPDAKLFQPKERNDD